MYTKSTYHEWIPFTTSVGTPSYVYAVVYKNVSDNLFTSISCPTLSCPTVLQFPRTHILLSLPSFTPTISIQRISMKDSGLPHTMVTLCETSENLLAKLRELQIAVAAAVEALSSAA
ncbi:hypothetical protein R3P38DRAFT_3215270 [Favolaschia claudopus]|uniref:Uncharacterized protein n=1 Tax=Favolaschia claudopus TaxID=2862362 RepID=A0AAW0A8Y6_9AGAR